MDIEEVIKKFRSITDELTSLERQINDHYSPIIKQLISNSDEEGLHRLLLEIPVCNTKMMVYQGLHEIRLSKQQDLIK